MLTRLIARSGAVAEPAVEYEYEYEYRVAEYEYESEDRQEPRDATEGCNVFRQLQCLHSPPADPNR